jgi:hypothetical protein
VDERHLRWLEYGVEECTCCDVEKSSFSRVAGLIVSYRLGTTVPQVHLASDGAMLRRRFMVRHNTCQYHKLWISRRTGIIV